MKKTILLLAAFALFCACDKTAPDPTPQEEVEVKTITLSENEHIIYGLGQSFDLTAVVDPETTTRALTWKILDQTILSSQKKSGRTVRFTSCKKGETTIEVSASDALAVCKVKVVQPAASVSFTFEELTLKVGEYQYLIPRVEPKDAYYEDGVTWSSNMPEYVSVDQFGKVMALKPFAGEALVQASVKSVSEDGSPADCVAVCHVKVTH